MAVHENGSKGKRSRQIGKTNKTTTLHVHHHLCYISLPPPHYLYVKFPSTYIYKALLAPEKDELFFLLLNWVQSPKMKLQENSPKFDIVVTREIKKGKQKETLKYFSILVAKARLTRKIPERK